MPTFTTVAWETLLEPRVRDSYKTDLISHPKSPTPPPTGATEEDDRTKKSSQMPNHVFISPTLYITPVSAPIPDYSSDPPSPSPYVVNHKRRGGYASGRRIGWVGESSDLKQPERNSNSDEVGESSVEQVGDLDGEFSGVEVGGGPNLEEDDDFFDPRGDSASVASSVDDLAKQSDVRSYISTQGEFFDADEDFFSDASVHSSAAYGPRVEELRAIRLSLLEEVDRRKSAEYTVHRMYSLWRNLGNLLCKDGLSPPSLPCGPGMELDTESIEQFCQELVVTRFVTEALGSGLARAEAEIAAEAIIEAKDQEISRLRDRLQYYEAVNHEMSQRNQEVMEAARRQRQKKRNQRRWLWSCVGLSATVGASVLAYLYLPQSAGKHHHHHALPSSSESSDATANMGTSESF